MKKNYLHQTSYHVKLDSETVRLLDEYMKKTGRTRNRSINIACWRYFNDFLQVLE